MANTAHLYKAKSGKWNISFNHPLRREGNIGKKIHRGLRVTDEQEAQKRRDEINELLALAEKGPAAVPSRTTAEKLYADVVVSAFYDRVDPEPVDYMALREDLMRIPVGVSKIQMVGLTGVGKSRLQQHLLQTTKENFPMRGAGRMTVADTETIVADVDYEAVMTFYSENEIREIVRENIMEACEYAHAKPNDRQKIATKLLVDSDKRFRFNFVLGNIPAVNSVTEVDDDDLDPEEPTEFSDLPISGLATEASLDKQRIDNYVTRIIQIATDGYDKARKDLKPTVAEDESVLDEYWLTYIDETEVDALAEEILEVLRERLCMVTGSDSWPATHRLPKTKDRDSFFRSLRPFYQNHRKFFGELVTPLVQGIRVRGRFYSNDLSENPSVSWVLLDGQGLGHEQEFATKQTATVSPEITRKFEMADVICLVERSVPPMVSGSPAPLLVSELVARGHIDKLILVFTHFESVNAPDLDQAARKTKVLESVAGVIQSLDSLPKTQRIKLEEELESKSYFLARLDKDTVSSGSKWTRLEFRRLCERLSTTIKPTYSQRRPEYNEYRVADALRRQITTFRRDWAADALASYHWKIMQALTNWIGNACSDGYPKRNLYPGQDLSRRVIAAISVELENPETWSPTRPDTLDEESGILNAIRTEVSRRVDELCRRYVIRDARTPDWLPAYRDIFGPGTRAMRAKRVARILEDRAPLPEEGLGEFIREIWQYAVLQGIDAALEQRAAAAQA